ncbi:hypothetical protein PR202_ga12644 [Eleusine coracana subsp. coracana]|uniref:Uncharacterized protein n=1 Tax=Eleusine coracana subsp. coracana TaxID=191504 RepID=A0AAV5CCQ3_ELECO|nr:hypothetical protein PR202_ga12644 [Eleusine coracana subsp. coracana]
MGEFDDYWARAYRGDSGVPHSDPQRLVTTWTGAFALGAAACVHHHASALASHLKSLPHRCAAAYPPVTPWIRLDSHFLACSRDLCTVD